MEPDDFIGRIFQINRSDGGVPKSAVTSARVTKLGLEGDRQRNTKVHGGPERALCLYSLEHILSLQAEGHPIYPGAIGENLTLTGSEWEKITPGVRLRFGEHVLVEITCYTAPCNTIASAFIDGNSQRVSQERHPGWSRVYACVLSQGVIRIGEHAYLA